LIIWGTDIQTSLQNLKSTFLIVILQMTEAHTQIWEWLCAIGYKGQHSVAFNCFIILIQDFTAFTQSAPVFRQALFEKTRVAKYISGSFKIFAFKLLLGILI
jgi:hypothetical protein